MKFAHEITVAYPMLLSLSCALLPPAFAECPPHDYNWPEGATVEVSIANTASSWPWDPNLFCHGRSDAQDAANEWRNSVSDAARENMPTVQVVDYPFNSDPGSIRDFYNVIRFDDVEGGRGETRPYRDATQPWVLVEMDIKLDINPHIPWLYKESQCNQCGTGNDYLVQIVLTHEFGHFFSIHDNQPDACCLPSVMSNAHATYHCSGGMEIEQCDIDNANEFWGLIIPSVEEINNLTAFPSPPPSYQDITVSWDASGSPGGEMWVERSTDGGVTFQIFETIPFNWPGHFEVVDQSPTDGGRHYYRIVPYDAEILFITPPVSAVPNLPPPGAIQPPGLVIAEGMTNQGACNLRIQTGSPYSTAHEVKYGFTPSLEIGTIQSEPENFGSHSFSGSVGKLYHVSAKGRRDAAQSALGPISTFVLPVVAVREFVNANFETSVQTAMPGQYGWHPVVLEGPTGQGGAAEYGFSPGSPIEGTRSAFARVTATSSGDMQQETRFTSAFASYPYPDNPNVMRFSYRATFTRAAWRLRGRARHYDANLNLIGTGPVLEVAGGAAGSGNGDSGVKFGAITVGDIPPAVRFIRAEFDLYVHSEGNGAAAEGIIRVDQLELRTLDYAKSTIKVRYANQDYGPAQGLGACPHNGSPTVHPGGTTTGLGGGDWWLSVDVRDIANQPVAGCADIKLDFTACTYPSQDRPDYAFVDAPTDASGHARFLQSLSFGGSDPCQYSLIVADHVWGDGFTGLRNYDQNGDLLVTLQDHGTFQAGYTSGQPFDYRCDYIPDGQCVLGDLGSFTSHFNSGHAVPGRESTVMNPSHNGAGRHPDSDQDREELGLVYAHVTDRFPEGSDCPPVPPNQAVTAVNEVGPGGRDVTLWLFAKDFADLAGIHARLAWPGTWRVDGIGEVRAGQLYAHTYDWTSHRREIVTAFECLDVRDEPLVVGRVDLHADRPGQLGLDIGNPYLEMIDCQIRPRVMMGVRQPIEGRTSAGNAKTAAGVPTVVMRGSPVSRDGARLELVIGNPGEITARVYDVMGRAVRTISQRESIGAGTHSILWNGNSDSGRGVASGVYVLKVDVAGRSFTNRVVIVR